MNCKKHERICVLWAMADGVCVKCNKQFICSHTPCDKVCPDCSEKYKLCTMCGESVEK